MGQQLYSVNNLGGYFSVPTLTNEARHKSQPTMRFRQFTQIEPDMGARKGDLLYFDKISNISSQGGTLAETAIIPSNNYTIRQDSLQVVEYGNGIKYTEKLINLSQISVSDSTKRVLIDDMAKTLDSAAGAQFKLSNQIAVITNTATTTFSTDGTALATAGANISDKNHRDIIDRMKKQNMPTYDMQNYVMVGSVNAMRGIYDFLEQKEQYTSMEKLYTGEIGSYYKCRLVEETNILSNAIGSNSIYGEAIYFGDDAVREGIVTPEEIRLDVPTDAGRQQKIVWLYNGGFKKTWDIASDADGEGRIVYVSSL